MLEHFPAFKRETGGYFPGLLLAVVATEQGSSPVIREGLRWVVRSRAEWCEELGCSPRTLGTVLTKLKKMGLLMSEVHMFDGKTRAFLRLSGDGLLLVEKIKTAGGGTK